MDVAGQVALVTGGRSGLGAATVRALVARGARVVSLDLGSAETDSAQVVSVAGDVTSAADVERAVAAASDIGPLSVLVNCAGIGSNQRVAGRSRDGTPWAGDLDAFRRVIEVNLVGTFNAMRLFAACVAARPAGEATSGVIVNTASIAAFEGQVGQAAYSASKAGVVAMTLTAARDLGPLGIRVVTIAPGMMETPLLGTVRDDVRAGLVASMVHPPRIGFPDEFASLACHLIENEYVNGETVRIDAAARLPHTR